MIQPPAPAPYPMQSPRARRRYGRYALALLTVLASAASIFLLVSLAKPVASAVNREGGTRVTLSARTSEGSTPSADALAQSAHIIGKRFRGAEVATSGGGLIVTVPGQRPSDAESLGRAGRLNIRPIVNVLEAKPWPALLSHPPGAVAGALSPAKLNERIAREKAVRQSDNRGVQFLAIQFEGTQCGAPDPLIDNDDPDRPLVTCSADHKFVYILGPSIISGKQLREARSRFDQPNGRYVIDLRFDQTAANTWSQFADAHSGTAVAYTLDTQVISAPAVDSSPHIAGDLTAFTSESARQLARTLNAGPLPLIFDASKPEVLAPKANSTSLWQARPPLGLVVTAIGLVVILLCLQAYLYHPGIHRLSTRRDR